MRAQIYILTVCLILGVIVDFGFVKSSKASVGYLDSTCHDFRGKLTVQDFTTALEINPKDVGAISGRAEAYLNVGQYLFALADIDSAIRSAPDVKYNYVIRARTLNKLGLGKKALEDCQRVEGDNTCGFYLWCSSLIREQAGDRKGALAALDNAIKLEPEYAYYYLTRSQFRYDMGDVSGSMRDYRSYCKHDYETPAASKILSNLLCVFAPE